MRWPWSRPKNQPVHITLTSGGGKDPIRIFDDDVFLQGGDTYVINITDRPLVIENSKSRPTRLKHRGRWYDVGREITEP